MTIRFYGAVIALICGGSVSQATDVALNFVDFTVPIVRVEHASVLHLDSTIAKRFRMVKWSAETAQISSRKNK